MSLFQCTAAVGHASTVQTESDAWANRLSVVVDTLSRSPVRTLLALTISEIREYASKGEQQPGHCFNFLGPC